MLGIAVVIAAFALVAWSVAADYQRKQSRTPDEYERELRAGAGGTRIVLRAGFGEIGAALQPSSEIIVKTQEAERKRVDVGGQDDDPERLEAWRRGLVRDARRAAEGPAGVG